MIMNIIQFIIEWFTRPDLKMFLAFLLVSALCSPKAARPKGFKSRFDKKPSEADAKKAEAPKADDECGGGICPKNAAPPPPKKKSDL